MIHVVNIIRYMVAFLAGFAVGWFAPFPVYVNVPLGMAAAVVAVAATDMAFIAGIRAYVRHVVERLP